MLPFNSLAPLATSNGLVDTGLRGSLARFPKISLSKLVYNDASKNGTTCCGLKLGVSINSTKIDQHHYYQLCNTHWWERAHLSLTLTKNSVFISFHKFS